MSKSPQPTGSFLSAPPKASVQPADLTGCTLSDYRILHRLGLGGMGQVYLAEQVSLKRKVALKVLKPELAANPTALQRFKAEAEAVARATHANIVQVYATGEADGLWYMALEYVEGRNLRDFVARKGPPDVLLAVSIMRQVAAALQRASELGIIHRDIKPENILLTRKGEVKVADFGLSRCLDGDRPAPNLTASGVTMGTPLYMSPEQVEGKQLDCRTDIYSFGITCYHMMAGQPPFQGATPFEVAVQHVQKEPQALNDVRPDLPERLCAIIHKMMAKDPEQRYQTGRDLSRDLVRLRDSLSGLTAATPSQSVPVELVPLSTSLTRSPASTTAPAASSSSAAATTPTATVPLPDWHRWLPLLVVGSVVLATLLGVAFAWLRQPSSSLPALPVAPTNATGEPRLSLRKQEQMLREDVERYLPPTGNLQQVRNGLTSCIELGAFYLELKRLDDAEAFFKRLSGLPTQNKYYPALGRLGEGIVLALRSKPEESNRAFRDVFRNRLNFSKPPSKGFPEPKRQDPPEVREAFLNRKLLSWLDVALRYNKQNNVSEKDWLPREVQDRLNDVR